MDPDKRFTCSLLSQHPYFDGFSNEFEREKKEQQKHLHREQQKLLQQQQQKQAQEGKMSNNVYAPGTNTNNKQQPQGVCVNSLFSFNNNFQ